MDLLGAFGLLVVALSAMLSFDSKQSMFLGWSLPMVFMFVGLILIAIRLITK